MKKPIRIYFICIQNRCRSQIAEAYAKHFGGSNVIVHSAGLEAGEIHPFTLQVMKEEGIDLRGHVSKPIDHQLFMRANVVVKLCEQVKERCPSIPYGIQNVQWDIPDPLPSGNVVDVRAARDEIKRHVLELLTQLNVLKADHGESAIDAELDEWAGMFRLLGDKTRLHLVSLLRERELCVCELVDVLQTSQPNISQHLRKLKDAGWISERKQGQWVYYSLNIENQPHLGAILRLWPKVSVNPGLARIGDASSCG